MFFLLAIDLLRCEHLAKGQLGSPGTWIQRCRCLAQNSGQNARNRQQLPAQNPQL